MSNPNREIDKTHLSIEQAEERGFLHRDYIAHCLRWSHVVRHLGRLNRYKTARILDIGCGKETPLIKTLYTMKMTPEIYYGVDMNKIEWSDMVKKISAKMSSEASEDTEYHPFHIEDQCDASDPSFNPDLTPTLITCFEVLEHVTPKKAIGILRNIWEYCDEDTVVFLSTPCYNGRAAKNHINEMTYEAMMCLLVDQGFKIEAQYGTFASQTDLKRDDRWSEIEPIFDELHNYYDSNLLSCIFAPMMPSASRNVMWRVSRTAYPDHSAFDSFSAIGDKRAWSSHPDWRDLKCLKE